jgi:predicted transglutaminase-like cysteine proteinase
MRKSNKIITAIVAAAMLMGLAPQADAFTLGRVGRDIGKVTRSAFLVEKAPTLAPMAHVMFCQSNPEDCRNVRRTRWGRAPVQMTAKRNNELRAINMMVNASITPRNDSPTAWGGDVWSLSPKAGDCDDYAVTKRHQLIAMGWPERSLHLAVTYTAYGEGHMVLVVRTSTGDMVLDNRVNAVRKWDKTGLKWKMLQASIDPRRWYQL